MLLILCHKDILLQFFIYFFTIYLLNNHNSNLCSDHNNKVNVLPQYAVPPMLFKISITKGNNLVILDVYGFCPPLFWLRNTAEQRDEDWKNGLHRGAQKLTGENLKPVWAEFSTLS